MKKEDNEVLSVKCIFQSRSLKEGRSFFAYWHINTFASCICAQPKKEFFKHQRMWTHSSQNLDTKMTDLSINTPMSLQVWWFSLSISFTVSMFEDFQFWVSCSRIRMTKTWNALNASSCWCNDALGRARVKAETKGLDIINGFILWHL